MKTIYSDRGEDWRSWLILGLLLAAFSPRSFAQMDTVVVPSDTGPGEGNLNRLVDSVTLAGKISTTVFRLEQDGRYVLTSEITVPAGKHLRIIAQEPGTTQESAPPQLLWTSNNDVPTDKFFDCFGDITLRNIWLLYADTRGYQVGSSVAIENDSLANLSGKGEVSIFDNVIFDYSLCPASAGGAVTVLAKHFKGTFTNCYFRNCTDPHFRYYGRALSFPFNTTGWHGDSVVFENCSFANIGYVLMQEGGEYHDYVKFNHCTFINVMMHTLESGCWNMLSVTNSIFVNAYMIGDLPLYRTYGYPSDGATIRIDSVASFGFVPDPIFGEHDRRILFTNSSHNLEKWVRDWMVNSPSSVQLRRDGDTDKIPIPQPMLTQETLVFFDSVDSQGKKIFPSMNRANLYDSINPGFLFPPSDTGAIKSFLNRRWYDSSDTLWAWKPQNSFKRIWPLEENLAYANTTLKTAGISGFPLGDLYHWWPEKYQQWKVQEASENDTINKWLHNGFHSTVAVTEYSGIPEKYELHQNYPNPFNPTTKIEYSIGRTGKVSLKVFNLLGEDVATLYAGDRTPGNYSATFDGRGFASGVYFYRLSAGSFLETKKFLLLK